MKARVVVDAHEVEGAGKPVPSPFEPRERRDPEIPPPRRESLEEGRVVQPARVPGEKDIERMARTIRREVHHVVRNPDRGAGCLVSQDTRGLRVRREEEAARAAARESARPGGIWPSTKPPSRRTSGSLNGRKRRTKGERARAVSRAKRAKAPTEAGDVQGVSS